MLKIAHRGLSATNPDNSIESFVCAVEAGFDMIELDIQLCKNNEIVVFHDRSLYGKMIEEYTLHELEEIGVISLKIQNLSLSDNTKQFLIKLICVLSFSCLSNI